ncbi:hypothetical protein ACOL24_02300 [Aliarcobacter butzleri]|uniref:hypothetical protein n=1 Tax=Aliarcobacter butzleri TaxID=28197 RepID=UPI003AFB174B
MKNSSIKDFQKQEIEYLKTKCKNKTGLSEQNLSFYLKKSKIKLLLNQKILIKINQKINEKKMLRKESIDIFANLKGKDSKTSLDRIC